MKPLLAIQRVRMFELFSAHAALWLIGVSMIILGGVQIRKSERERQKAEEKQRFLSVMDELTGLYNRRGFLAASKQKLLTARRMNKGVLLFYADMDGLKEINDNLGHKEGDRAIMETARILKGAFRESDIVGRVGGDEFAIFGIENKKADEEQLGNSLQNLLKERNKAEHLQLQLSLSLGIVRAGSGHLLSLEELLAQADLLMYEKKKNRKKKTGT